MHTERYEVTKRRLIGPTGLLIDNDVKINELYKHRIYNSWTGPGKYYCEAGYEVLIEEYKTEIIEEQNEN